MILDQAVRSAFGTCGAEMGWFVSRSLDDEGQLSSSLFEIDRKRCSEGLSLS